jgi:hypothetical protein
VLVVDDVKSEHIVALQFEKGQPNEIFSCLFVDRQERKTIIHDLQDSYTNLLESLVEMNLVLFISNEVSHCWNVELSLFKFFFFGEVEYMLQLSFHLLGLVALALLYHLI